MSKALSASLPWGVAQTCRREDRPRCLRDRRPDYYYRVTIVWISSIIGKSITRLEDKRRLHGRGRFISDIAVSGTLHANFVRSLQPHAVIRSGASPHGAALNSGMPLDLADRPRDRVHRRVGDGAGARDGARPGGGEPAWHRPKQGHDRGRRMSPRLGGFASRRTVTAGSSALLAAKAVAEKAKKVVSTCCGAIAKSSASV
jgi:CO/xanthine dehydrogenase Mo-binding subunit